MKNQQQTESTALAQEIERLEARRVAITAEVDTARATLDAARRKYVPGTGEDSQITAAQNRVSALAATVESITDELSGLGEKLLVAQNAEKQTSEAARIAVLESEQAKLLAEHDAVTAQTDAAVENAAVRIVEIRARYFALSQERSQLLREDRKFLSNDDFLIPRDVSPPMEIAVTIHERSRATTPERFGNKLPQRN
jgi:predicted  nucleic acid-binding Zn-ribbon protein